LRLGGWGSLSLGGGVENAGYFRGVGVRGIGVSDDWRRYLKCRFVVFVRGGMSFRVGRRLLGRMGGRGIFVLVSVGRMRRLEGLVRRLGGCGRGRSRYWSVIIFKKMFWLFCV